MDRNKLKKRLAIWYSILWLFILIALWEGYFIYFPDTTSTKSKWIGLFAGAIAILTASCKINEILSHKIKNLETEEDISMFNNLVSVFSRKKYFIITILCIFIGIILFKYFNWQFLICFCIGALANYLSNKIVYFIYPRGMARVQNLVDTPTCNNNYKLLFNSSSVLSLFSVGVSLCFIVILFHIFKDCQVLIGYISGFAVLSLVDGCGSVVSKKAVCSANEIINNMGYELNVNCNPLNTIKSAILSFFDTLMINSDVTLTFIMSIVASMLVGSNTFDLQGMFFPIAIAANGVFVTVISLLIICFKKTHPIKGLFVISLFATILLCISAIYCTKLWFPEYMEITYPIILGAIFGFISIFSNLNILIPEFKTVKNVANAGIGGINQFITKVIQESFINGIIPIISLGLFITLCFIVSKGIEIPQLGLWGITLGILSMISAAGIVMSIGLFGCMLDSTCNHSEIKVKNSECLQDEKEYFNNSNIIKGQSKNFTTGSSILCAFSLIVTFYCIVPIEEVNMLNPYIIGSLFLGIISPYLFCVFIINSSSKIAKNMALEAKSQFKKYPQILREEMLPDYSKYIKIMAKKSSIQTILSIIPLLILFYVSIYFFKTESIVSFLIGSIIGVICVLYVLNNSQIISTTAKKYLASEFLNIEKTYEYETISLGKSIFKALGDLITPACIVYIKFVSIFALMIAFLLIK